LSYSQILDRIDAILSYRFGLPVRFLHFSSEPVCGARGPSVMGGVRAPVVVELYPLADACTGLGDGPSNRIVDE
jgi:hypothetical protein